MNAQRAGAVAIGVGIELLAVAVAELAALPSLLMWTGLAAVFLSGLAGGYAVGALVGGGWRTRARYGLLTGLVGGLALGTTLWAGMSYRIPRADRSPFWAFNYLLATNPVGSSAFPWLYTGQTLALPLVAASALLLGIEGYVAAGAATGPAPRPDSARSE